MPVDEQARLYAAREGFVVSTAIDKFAYVIVKERFDDQIYLNYTKKEIRSDVSEIEHELIRESMRMTGVTGGIEVTTLSDIPSEGAGLGSSSSFTVGLLNAFHMYQGRQVTAERAAASAFQAVGPDAAGADGHYFAETGHTLSGIFRQHWETTGGVERYGLPISEQLAEPWRKSGREYTVQYFERARLEHHPEAAGTPYEVLASRLGTAVLTRRPAPRLPHPLTAPSPCRSAFRREASGPDAWPWTPVGGPSGPKLLDEPFGLANQELAVRLVPSGAIAHTLSCSARNR